MGIALVGCREISPTIEAAVRNRSPLHVRIWRGTVKEDLFSPVLPAAVGFAVQTTKGLVEVSYDLVIMVAIPDTSD